MYPTPIARDYKGEGFLGQLGTVVKMWRTPSATVVEPKSSVVKLKGRTPQDPQVGLADQVGGQLNPMWVEWLMGFPIGWTDLGDSETP